MESCARVPETRFFSAAERPTRENALRSGPIASQHGPGREGGGGTSNRPTLIGQVSSISAKGLVTIASCLTHVQQIMTDQWGTTATYGKLRAAGFLAICVDGPCDWAGRFITNVPRRSDFLYDRTGAESGR